MDREDVKKWFPGGMDKVFSTSKNVKVDMNEVKVTIASLKAQSIAFDSLDRCEGVLGMIDEKVDECKGKMLMMKFIEVLDLIGVLELVKMLMVSKDNDEINIGRAIKITLNGIKWSKVEQGGARVEQMLES